MGENSVKYLRLLRENPVFKRKLLKTGKKGYILFAAKMDFNLNS